MRAGLSAPTRSGFSRRRMTKNQKLAALLAVTVLVPSMTGCIALPLVAGANMIAKSGTQTVVLTGPRFATDLFREAAIRSGGTVTAKTGEYAKAEFSATAVKVEFQVVGKGEYQLIGSSGTTVARTWELKDNIGLTTQQIADHLVANGFKLVSNTRNRGF
jgi:hypothetical protein